MSGAGTPPKPRIALLSAGGTIESAGLSRLDLAWYDEHAQRLEEGSLVAALPELAHLAEIEQVSCRRISSAATTTGDWLDLGRLVSSLLAMDHYQGVVISHGTNTLEETAFFLHLCVCSTKPVVLVGAMRPPTGLGSDAAMNLLRAVQVAASGEARGHGVLVLMNDTIFAARDVTKTSTYRLDAFRAPDLGPLGYADSDGRTIFYHRSLRVPFERSPFESASLRQLPRVDLVVSHVGADGALVDACVAAGAMGIVSAATGAGRPTPKEAEAFDRAIASGVVVCQSSRVGSGRVVRSPSLRKRGVVTSDNLQPWKARILLSLALTVTSDPDEIQEFFETL